MRHIKAIFTLVFFLLTTSTAGATKARLLSMANSKHVLDEQQIFENPLYLNYLDSFFSIESGISTATSTTTVTSNAEAVLGFKINSSDKLALAFGHQDSQIVYSRNFINSVALLNFDMSQNPIHLIYSTSQEDTQYAFSLQYSYFKDKLNQITNSTAGTSFGVEAGPWQISGQYTMINSEETLANRFDGSGYILGNIYYSTDTSMVYASYSNMPVKAYNMTSAIESHIVQNLRLGFVDTSAKDGHDPFWGLELLTTGIDCKVKGSLKCQKTARSVAVPVWIGFETEATSWLKLRASIRQTVLFNQSKDDVGYPASVSSVFNGTASEFAEGPNSTQMSIGAGLVFKNVNVDGSVQAANTQVFNFSNFLSQVSLKYHF